MDKITNFIFSPKLALFALVTFAISMAAATFVENDFGTQTAWNLIYNAWWFEMLMLILLLNFFGNIFRYKLYRKEKIWILCFHVGFIVILIGAGITRYTGYEGVMRIREGQSSNVIISNQNYLQFEVLNERDKFSFKKELYFSPIKENNFSIDENYGSGSVRLSFKEFIADATLGLSEAAKDGEEIIELVISSGNGRETIFLRNGEIRKIGDHQHLLSFHPPLDNGVSIYQKDGELKIKSSEAIDFFIMASETAGRIEANKEEVFQFNVLYKFHDFSFVPVKYLKNGTLKWKSSSKKPKDNNDNIDDILLVEANINGLSKEIPLVYSHGFLPQFSTYDFDGTTLEIGYGSLEIQTDFHLKLRDFQLEKYPGSTSPSSYASEVTILDQGAETDFRIYMNNVLDYDGYRFFQASYDTDEKGTVLAVNHDKPGTYITYIGYILLSLGMFLTLFSKGSRFQTTQRKLNKLKANKISILLILLMIQGFCYASVENSTNHLDSILRAQNVNKDHAALFGRLMVQDLDGRIKPLNTLASEFLRKVSRKIYYKGDMERLDANQVFLSIHLDPATWSTIPIIKIDKKKGGEVFKKLNTNSKGLVSFESFLDEQDNYILEKYVLEANEKKPAERSEFDKEIITVDERFNIVYNVLSGNYLKIFPKRNDESKTWYPANYTFNDFSEEDGRFCKGIIPLYFLNIEKAKTSGNWEGAEDKLAYIKKYQHVLAKEIIPNTQRTEAELWYNELNLNYWLFQSYFLLGVLLLGFSIVKIFSRNKWIAITTDVLVVFTLISFLIHTFNLILRWYIAGHPPWSNGYEMIIFVAWSLLFFGLIFYRKSDFSLPLATVFSGVLIFVSYLDWLNPEITNLMPVLKSYWLKIHVAIIISSYAPLALSALLGIMALILINFNSGSNKKRIEKSIKELSYINEMSMTIGLFLLAIGTFLGGVWANESWGRYWAWDPKETWALISVIFYAAVLHLRLVPKLNNPYVLNTASVLAFFSIMMTSFGVNYYLTGLHSYATGDPVPVPVFVYIIVVVVVMLSVVSYWNFYRNKWKKD